MVILVNLYDLCCMVEKLLSRIVYPGALHITAP